MITGRVGCIHILLVHKNVNGLTFETLRNLTEITQESILKVCNQIKTVLIRTFYLTVVTLVERSIFLLRSLFKDVSRTLASWRNKVHVLFFEGISSCTSQKAVLRPC